MTTSDETARAATTAEDSAPSITSIAERIVGLVEPKTVLDVGSAASPLAQALATRGVEARGTEVTEAPIEGRYDLIVCAGALEHLAVNDAHQAIDTLCAATDLILFSSPSTAQWAAWFAERGFFRRTEADVTFLGPSAVLFERSDPSKHSLVERYERYVASLRNQALGKQPKATSGSSELVKQWEAEVFEARHQLLTTRDHVVGIEATAGKLRRDNAQLRKRIGRVREQLEKTRESLRAERRRVAELERQANSSFVRRVARKLRGTR